MSWQVLRVEEGNEPLLTITTMNTSYQPPIPFNLAGPPPSTVTAIIKLSPDTLDAAAIATIPCTVIDGPNGVFTLQIPATATQNPGRYFYKINALIGFTPIPRTMTLQHGDFVVVNA